MRGIVKASRITSKIVAYRFYRARAVPAEDRHAASSPRSGGTKLISASSTNVEAFLPTKPHQSTRCSINASASEPAFPPGNAGFLCHQNDTAHRSADPADVKTQTRGPFKPAFGRNGQCGPVGDHAGSYAVARRRERNPSAATRQLLRPQHLRSFPPAPCVAGAE